MKDLDKTQVYDLRDITEEQARKLHDWLVENDIGWVTNYYNFYWAIQDYASIKYTDMSRWLLSGSKPTTHISTLFEQSYEEQLQEAKKKLDHYKKEVERLENESKPKVGDVVKAWDSENCYYSIGIIKNIEDYGYLLNDGMYWDNAKKLT